MNLSTTRLTNRFQARFGYDVCFGSHVLDPGQPLLARELRRVFAEHLPAPTLAFLDGGLVAAQPDLPDRLTAYANAHPQAMTLCLPPVVLPGGEAAKDGLAVCLEAVATMREAGLCRQSCALIIGGGAFQDAVGMAASLFHRGVRVVRMPSTVLSQNDSGVGVKNGVNLGGVKNLLGTFAPPALVVNDLALLDTVSDRDWVAGAAEAFKVALICDLDFTEWLIEHGPEIPARDPAVMAELIARCAALHVQHIATSGDPFEYGSARPLDFGHWSAHKLESLSSFAMRHGEAVAVGLALDFRYAVRQSFISECDAGRVIHALHRAGLPIWSDWLEAERDGERLVLAGIEEFREHLGGTLQVTFPAPIGSKREICELDRTCMLAAIGDLKQVWQGMEATP
jgi:3-dehydroquinate synthase